MAPAAPAICRTCPALIGERDETTDSVTTDAYGAHSNQRSIRRIPIMPPEVLRTFPFGTGVVMLRSARPIITTLRPWTARPDAAQLRADRAEIEQLLQHARGRIVTRWLRPVPDM